jgi:hypothetical protein
LNDYTSNDPVKNQIHPTFGERLALIAQVIVTIGDILATVSAGILIEEGLKEEIDAEQEKKEQEQQLAKMQSQIDSLQSEIKLMKKNNIR